MLKYWSLEVAQIDMNTWLLCVRNARVGDLANLDLGLGDL